MKEFNIGDILTEATYTLGAIWCNMHNAFIEKVGDDYVIKAVPEPTEKEKAQDELQSIDAQLKEQDELSIRNICSMLINPKDLFAINKLKEREKIKEQLRARRKELEKIISGASV